MEIEVSPIQLPLGRVIISGLLSVMMVFTAVVLVIVYAMNVWCVASDARRPLLIGSMSYEATKDRDGNALVPSSRAVFRVRPSDLPFNFPSLRSFAP